MNLDQLHPHSGDHSIQNAILAIEWSNFLDIPKLEEMRAELLSLIGASYKEEVQQTVRFNVGVPGANPVPVQELGGYGYSSFIGETSQLDKQIQITRSNCLFIVSDYKKWDTLIREVQEVFQKILSVPDIFVKSVGLQYSDRFIWQDDLDSFNATQVFNKNSKYIAKHLFDCDNLWHSHHGYFESIDTPVSAKQLDNINVALLEAPNNTTSIEILTSHKCDLDQIMQGNSVLDICIELLNSMHTKNKKILRELLTKELQLKIGIQD